MAMATNPRWTRLASILAGAGLALVGVGVLPAGARADTISDEGRFVRQINALRVSLDLPPLTVDPELTAKARGWAQTMASAGRIWHSNLSDGVSADWGRLGENVGMGHTVEGLHAAFVASPHHYENLVDPKFTLIGVGVVRNPDGLLFVSENFMQLQAPAVVTPAPPVKGKTLVKSPPRRNPPLPAPPRKPRVRTVRTPPGPRPVVRPRPGGARAVLS
jgi:hypothetical protein